MWRMCWRKTWGERREGGRHEPADNPRHQDRPPLAGFGHHPLVQDAGKRPARLPNRNQRGATAGGRGGDAEGGVGVGD